MMARHGSCCRTGVAGAAAALMDQVVAVLGAVWAAASCWADLPRASGEQALEVAGVHVA